MIKIVICGMALLLAQELKAQTTVDSSYANSHYQQRLEFFKTMPDNAHEVVFFGNSLIEAGEWQELFNSRHVINRGISGDVSFGIIARLAEVVSSKPKKIFLLTGTNDLKRGFPTEVIITNYGRIFSYLQLHSPKNQIIAQSILPINEQMISVDYKRITNSKIREVNQELKKLAIKYHVSYLDLQPLFEDESGAMKKEYTTDDIHLKMPAYILWADYIKKQKLL